MTITFPELSLVVLVGPSGSGKSTFARKHFRPTEVLSSDFFRAMIADNDTDQSVSAAAFELLHLACAKRLELGRLTVIDATNVQPQARKPLLEMARRYHVVPVAVVLDLPEALCHERNQQRSDRQFGAHVVHGHREQLKRSLGRLHDEGFRQVHVLTSVEEIEAAQFVREPLHVDRKGETGPFDVIGDVHGCLDELQVLLDKIGYTRTPVEDPDGRPTFAVQPPPGRKVVFVGDLVDRGPDTPGVLRLVLRMVDAGTALCVRGNHDDKLLRKLKGRDVSVSHGLAASLEQLEAQPPDFVDRVRVFLDGLVTHYVLDGGKLVVAHAGLKASMQGRVSERVRAFTLYGETTGESDEFGLPVRVNWAADYRGRATVVYGHTPVLNPEWVNRTICIDTGCVFGGALTALRYPESELVSVPAARAYAESKRPLRATLSEAHVPPEPRAGQQQADDVLDIADVMGKRVIHTRLMDSIVIREGNAAAALEAVSRFAADPHWLIYVPPTMAPCATSPDPGHLEHPREAFAYFASQDVPRVVCEAKHMGSRAVAIVCRDAAVAGRRFGVTTGEAGVCLTRTGRRFFDDAATEAGFLDKVRSALDGADCWQRFGTDWVCLDGELMPWSAKARELLRRQYAAAGSAGRAALAEVVKNLTPQPPSLQGKGEQEGVESQQRQTLLLPSPKRGGDGEGVDLHPQPPSRSGEGPGEGSSPIVQLQQRFAERAGAVGQFVEAYRRYCWPVHSLADLRFAPFHLLATEGKVHVDQDHAWHMDTLANLAAHGDGLVLATPYRVVDVKDAAAVEAGIRWWEELTAAGGEGMVVKPLAWVSRGRRGLVQPAVKVRGREYLRIIYGPEYTRPENIDRLRARAVGFKQSLALREFALGLEGLERFVAREPLRRVHECSFAVLALESEPIDPRL